MSQYTVLDCRFKNTWTSKTGRTYSSYKLKIDDGEEVFDVETALPVKAPEPEKGQTIEGDLEPGRYGTELRNAKMQGLARSDSAPAKQEPFRKHPAEVRAVQRSAAQKVGVQQMALLGHLGKLAGMTDEQLAAKLVSLIDWFERDVKRAALDDQATRLVDAGTAAMTAAHDAEDQAAYERFKASQSHVEAPVAPREGDPSMESHEEMEERIRAEVIRDNTLQRMP